VYFLAGKKDAAGKTSQEILARLDNLVGILDRLNVVSRLLVLDLVRSVKSKQEQVEILHTAGFSAREIAELLGIKYGTVGVTLFNIRQTKAKKKAKRARRSRR
jgi:DNA-directed RNA polymerase specialized sigma24 family protein